ncbi:MAG: hypothetical protein HOQ21_05640 [Dermatophilaceae bacterium]|nr:hypothetical protein [Dermatophilaceae bacterium]
MTQDHSAPRPGVRSRPLGWQWWAALVVVTVLLGSLGRSDGGFWGVFLWSVVGFVVGSVVAIVMKGREPASPTGRTEVPGGQR